ncbi:hypothetical protein FB479_106115 [Brevibacillus sp. AG162]|uniref:hypothetical protein n=1 Tax=Brevibacillus sp. AG162 TaxID=2572910 RepID=UPI00114D5A53|nr:hypothetical protein [Brevibacillus sp. AG162]TQK62032.1 hypothetical protein FB479_106115 [Brevibacillus sp. AG162]
MLTTNFEASENINKKINYNIYLIFELFFECCNGLDYDTFIQEIFPSHFYRENRQRCINILVELQEFTVDSFEHVLPPIYEYALYNIFDWWLDVTDVDFNTEISSSEILNDDDEYLAKHINNIAEYKYFMFDDHDFLNVPLYVKAYQQNPEFVINFLHIDIEEYSDLMPDDIRKSLKIDVHKYRNKIATDYNEESTIVKMIYSSTKLKERDPIRLMETSETQLSDDIAHVLFMKLSDIGLIISREMPSGFANKVIGELDFCIYSNNDNVFRLVAVGENKEWKNYGDQFKQLLGYMDKYVNFGFIILFNKSTRLSTVLEKRKTLLQNFYVEIEGEKHFETEQIIESPDGMNDVIVTIHSNPENGSIFRIYHFIVNAYLPERKETAKQARKK